MRTGRDLSDSFFTKRRFISTIRFFTASASH